MAPNADSDENAVSRLGEARDLATKESNYFFIFGLGFVLLYVAKLAGYHLDEVLVGKDVTDVRSGAFIYLVASQFSMTLCMVRTSDAAAIEASIKHVLRGEMEASGRTISEIYPNSREWFAPVTSKIVKVPQGGAWLWTFNLTTMLSALLAFVAYCLPVLAGLYYIGDPRDLQFTSSPDIELTVVVITTLLCGLWIVSAIGVVMLLKRLEPAREAADENHLSGRGSGQSQN
jgi:hypothetical protein